VSILIRDPRDPAVILYERTVRTEDLERVMDGLRPPEAPVRSFLRAGLEALRSRRDELEEVLRLEQGRSGAEVSAEWEEMERFVGALLDVPDPDAGFEPRGLTVALLSFVRPLFHAVSVSFSALLAGNPVILKPAEGASWSTEFLVGILKEADPGFEALRILIGDREVGRKLACHERVECVFFMGTFENGMRVRQDTLSRPSREVLLHLGNRNVALLCADAGAEELDLLVREAFRSSGQDCRNVSIAFLSEKSAAGMIEAIEERVRSLGPFLLSDPSRLDRALKFAEVSKQEGARIMLRGRSAPDGKKAWLASPSLVHHDSPDPGRILRSVSLQAEILGPYLSLVTYRDEGHLLSQLSSLQHAHSCLLLGRDPPFSDRIPFSRVLRNVAISEADPCDSVHYRKRNGNHALLGLQMPLQFMRRIRR
jgi:acyl-CoA reductase-like NAD-dependent aldehyde dehydrogenase